MEKNQLMIGKLGRYLAFLRQLIATTVPTCHNYRLIIITLNHGLNARIQESNIPALPHYGELLSYWYWLWCPGLSPVLVSIALPFAFHSWCFPFALICHWSSVVFLLYGRCIATHSVDHSLTHLLHVGEFRGLGLALGPSVVVPEAEQRCAWSRKLVPNFCPGRGRTSDLGGI